MENSDHLQDHKDAHDREDDLGLYVWFPSLKRARNSSPNPNPNPNLLLHPQTNSPSLEMQMSCPNPNPDTLWMPSTSHNTNLMLEFSSSESSHGTNPTFESSSTNRNTNPTLELSSDHNNNNNHQDTAADVNVNAPVAPALRRRRRAPSQGKSETVPAPFPWATDRRAIVHNRRYLLQNNILTITGRVQCKRCEQEFEMRLNLEEKLAELQEFIGRERDMHDRAPDAWVNPQLPKCLQCGKENSAKPILGSTKKREINWLFLLLSQMLGCCTLNQLKYFCKHTQIHRTGAKNRLLYHTYMNLLKQLVPEWFHA